MMSKACTGSPRVSSSVRSAGAMLVMLRGRECRSSCGWKLVPCDRAASGSDSTAAPISQPAARKPSDNPPQPENKSSTRGHHPPERRFIFRRTARTLMNLVPLSPYDAHRKALRPLSAYPSSLKYSLDGKPLGVKLFPNQPYLRGHPHVAAILRRSCVRWNPAPGREYCVPHAPQCPSVPAGLRSANRYRNEDNRGSAMVGFRVARALR